MAVGIALVMVAILIGTGVSHLMKSANHRLLDPEHFYGASAISVGLIIIAVAVCWRWKKALKVASAIGAAAFVLSFSALGLQRYGPDGSGARPLLQVPASIFLLAAGIAGAWLTYRRYPEWRRRAAEANQVPFDANR